MVELVLCRHRRSLLVRNSGEFRVRFYPPFPMLSAIARYHVGRGLCAGYRRVTASGKEQAEQKAGSHFCFRYSHVLERVNSEFGSGPAVRPGLAFDTVVPGYDKSKLPMQLFPMKGTCDARTATEVHRFNHDDCAGANGTVRGDGPATLHDIRTGGGRSIPDGSVLNAKRL